MLSLLMAESEGFKPPVRINRTADFESAPFGHSGNFPNLRYVMIQASM